MRLKDKVAVITGAASGFGEGMARRFAEEGARVVIADLNGKAAERVAGDIGKAAIWTQTDVSQRAEFDEMEILETFEFLPNQIIMFIKTFNSWHSVRPMTGSGSKAMRRTLTINIEHEH